MIDLQPFAKSSARSAGAQLNPPKQSSALPRDENVVPLINVVFLLLLYFLLLGTLRLGHKLELPFSDTGHVTPPEQIMLKIDEHGTMDLSGAEVDLESLETQLKKIASSQQHLRVFADAKADAFVVAQVSQTAARAGMRHLTLNTQKRISPD